MLKTLTPVKLISPPETTTILLLETYCNQRSMSEGGLRMSKPRMMKILPVSPTLILIDTSSFTLSILSLLLRPKYTVREGRVGVCDPLCFLSSNEQVSTQIEL